MHMTEHAAGSDEFDLFGGEYEPSPVPRIRDQVALFQATDGTQGNTLEDRPVVILTTIGGGPARSERTRSCASRTTASTLRWRRQEARPRTRPGTATSSPIQTSSFQDGRAVLHLRARELFGAEKQRWWPVAEHFWPHYPEYRQRAAGREIPLILLEPIAR
jgi:hypothetical protein